MGSRHRARDGPSRNAYLKREHARRLGVGLLYLGGPDDGDRDHHGYGCEGRWLCPVCCGG